MDANVQGLFHEDIRVITLTLFLLWSVTNLVYYGTIFGIEVRTSKYFQKGKNLKLTRSCT